MYVHMYISIDEEAEVGDTQYTDRSLYIYVCSTLVCSTAPTWGTLPQAVGLQDPLLTSFQVQVEHSLRHTVRLESGKCIHH